MRLRAVILDWAGTIVDFGSRAPIAALQSVFANAGVPVSIEEARESMGLAKKAHIRAILEIPRVRDAWILKYHAHPVTSTVDQLYAEFVPTQVAVLENHSQLIPGVAEAIGRMRSRGLKIGTTTGYNRTMLDYLLRRGAEQDFCPDSAACPDDVPAGRPFPWMCYLNAIRLEAYPMAALVKIGDTVADVEEGVNAGMWTIGVTRTGNEIGLTEEEWEHLREADRQFFLSRAERRLAEAGAHYIAPSVAECDATLDQIEARVARGEKP
jgi:phosphonoacetaldehyde hydrolase